MSAAEARLTPQQYLEIERAAETKSEFFNGEMFAMSGTSMEHNFIAGDLFGELRNLLSGKECTPIISDIRVKVSETGLYCYPDVAVVCGKPQVEDQRVDTLLNPRVIVEVLSPSTEAYDRGFKFQQYQQIASLREYVLISQDQPLVEHFQRQQDGRWLITFLRGLDAVLRLPALDCEVPLHTIYQRVDFAGSISSEA